MTDSFRLNSVINLNPLFISLGLPDAAFKSFNPAIPPTFFDAAVNIKQSDELWVFKGADYHRYNLRERRFVEEATPSRISDFGKFNQQHLPPLFSSGVNTVVYGGSAFPDFFYFFSGETYVRVNSNVLGGGGGPAFRIEMMWAVDEGPRGVLGAWAVGAFTNPDGTFTRPGIMVGLHGEGSRFASQVHFFRNGQYVRHDLRTGGAAAGPVPIKEVWRLPSPFTERIDLAFYGAGAEAQKIYFFSGANFVLYDPELNQVIRSGSVEQEFRDFGRFMTQPQLFLVENMSLRTYLGPLQDGPIADSSAIAPGSMLHKVLVIETRDSSTTSIQASVLDQQDAGTVHNFTNQVNKQTSQAEGAESFQHHIQAAAHGDVSATGFWGGEVNANFGEQGGTDRLRKDFAGSVFNAVSSQVTESRQQQVVKVLTSTDQITHEEHVLNITEFTQKNDTDHVINVAFFQIVQPFLGLLVLNSARLGYSDGLTARVVDLPEFSNLLDEKLAPTQSKDAIIKYVVGELSHIADANSRKQSLLTQGDGTTPEINAGLVTMFTFVAPDGATQTLTVPGIVKATNDWLNPTRSMVGRTI